MLFRIEGFDNIRSKMELAVALHATQGILFDVLGQLPLKVVTYKDHDTEDCAEDIEERIGRARNLLNGVIEDLLDGKEDGDASESEQEKVEEDPGLHI